MTLPNKKVDAYIGKSAEFAKPILNHLRAIILATCPEVEEDIKWGIPHYSYKGDHLCMMAAFSKHCSFNLYKAESMKDQAIQDGVKAGKKFGYMDKVKDVSELPARNRLVAYLEELMALNESGVKKRKPAKEKTAAAVEVPTAFTDALKQNAKANAVFESKSPSFRKQYIQWIADAKTTDTQQKRIEQSIEWIAAGKDRFWQYKK